MSTADPAVLTDQGWRTEQQDGLSYYWHNDSTKCQLDPPYFELFGLEAETFASHSREDIFAG